MTAAPTRLSRPPHRQAREVLGGEESAAHPPLAERSGPPDQREAAIIAAARDVYAWLPEPFVAGYMFFQFDPGFNAELGAARREWRGTSEPLQLDGLTPERRFDVEAGYTHDDALRVLALGLACRWGLDPDRVVHALAVGARVNFPYYGVEPDLVDEETGSRYTRITAYTAFVWRELRPALARLGLPSEPVLFPDRRTASRRIRGMRASVAARTMALYFLTRAAPGQRDTGGGRTWDDAEELWRDQAGGPNLPYDDRAWRRNCRRLLGHIRERRMAAVERLLSVQHARGLSDADWATFLGVPLQDADGRRSRDSWMGVWCGAKPSASFLRAVRQALPEIADDLVFDA